MLVIWKLKLFFNYSKRKSIKNFIQILNCILKILLRFILELRESLKKIKIKVYKEIYLLSLC